VFSLLDQRTPNDHDGYYTAHLRGALADLTSPVGDEGALARITDVFLFSEGGMHPPLAQTALLVDLHVFGASTTTFRLSTLPFLLLLIAGTYWAGRVLLGHRFGLMAGFVVGTLPVIINCSRKWEPMFHAAAISVLALVMVVQLVRHPTGRRLEIWLAFGLLQGLRLYTHPIVLPDVALLFGLLASFFVVSAWGKGATAQWRWLRGWLLSVVAFAGVGGWYLGLLSPWFGEPSYGLRSYLSFKAWMLGNAAEVRHDFSGIEAAVKVLANLVFCHWMVGYALLLLIPGLVAAAAGPFLRVRGAADRRVGRTATFLAILVTVQLPLVIWTARVGGFTTDWLYLAAPTVLACLAALHLLPRRFKRIPRRAVHVGVAALLSIGLATSYGPLAYSLLGPDPFTRPATAIWPPLLSFAYSEWGPRPFTHHMVMRSPSPVDVFPRSQARARGARGFRPNAFEFGLWDLQYQLARGNFVDEELVFDCDWRWALPDDTSFGGDPWAFVFAGYSDSRPSYDERVERTRFHVVRLRYNSSPEITHLLDMPQGHPALEPECIEVARTRVAQRIAPTGGTATVVNDTEHYFFREEWDASYRDSLLWRAPDEWFRPLNQRMTGPTYLNRIIVVDREGDSRNPPGEGAP